MKTNDDDIIISTTGHTSREVYKIREELGQEHKKNFYCIGSMGHVSQIALAIAENTNKRVICLDGDGSLAMHLGNLLDIFHFDNKRISYIVFNNHAHLSVGGQKTSWGSLDIFNFLKLTKSGQVFSLAKKVDIESTIEKILMSQKSLLEVKVKNIVTNNLPRPKETPKALKEQFMRFLDE